MVRSTFCVWPCTGHHWYKPVAPVRPDLLLHSLPYDPILLRPPTRRFVRSAIQYGVLTFLGLVIVLWLGAEMERLQMKNHPSTLSFYNQQETVCGMTTFADAPGVDTRVFETAAAALARNEGGYNESSSSATTSTTSRTSAASDASSSTTVVAHCGDCGSCSTPHDIQIYNDTKNTLFVSTTTCAKRALIWGRKTATKCMEDEIGFSDDCNHCWVENIMCDLRKCIFTCILYGLFAQVDGGGGDENGGTTALNPCTQCDETRCGPAFVECAGANRRRSGILSDIERDKTLEVCSVVTPGWLNNEELHDKWEEQQAERDNAR